MIQKENVFFLQKAIAVLIHLRKLQQNKIKIEISLRCIKMVDIN